MLLTWLKIKVLLPLKYAYNITVCITTVQFIKTNVYEWMKIVLSLDSTLRFRGVVTSTRLLWFSHNGIVPALSLSRCWSIHVITLRPTCLHATYWCTPTRLAFVSTDNRRFVQVDHHPQSQSLRYALRLLGIYIFSESEQHRLTPCSKFAEGEGFEPPNRFRLPR